MRKPIVETMQLGPQKLVAAQRDRGDTVYLKADPGTPLTIAGWASPEVVELDDGGSVERHDVDDVEYDETDDTVSR